MAQECSNLVLAFQVQDLFNEKRINCAFFHKNKRLIEVAEFIDNEYFSGFESLMVQYNPTDEQTILTILQKRIEVRSESIRMQEILGKCQAEKKITKENSDFGQLNIININKILENDFNTYPPGLQISTQCIQCLVEHLKLHKDATLSRNIKLSLLNTSQFMRLDFAVFDELEKIPNFKRKMLKTKKFCVAQYLDHCITDMGKSCLRRWIQMPLQSIEEINHRLDIVQFLRENTVFRKYLIENFLLKVPNLDYLTNKLFQVSTDKNGKVNQQDCLDVQKLIHIIKCLIGLARTEQYFYNSQVISKAFIIPFEKYLGELETLQLILEKGKFVNGQLNFPFPLDDGSKLILDEVDEVKERQVNEIMTIRQKLEKELDQSVTLIKFDSRTYVFTTQWEINVLRYLNQNSDKFKKIKVFQNQIRIFVQSFQNYEKKYQEYRNILQELIEIQVTLNKISQYYPIIEKVSKLISEIDVLVGFALETIWSHRSYAKPNFTEKKEIIIKETWYPQNDEINSPNVYNNFEINNENQRLNVISGPLKSGKSTYMRQVALCVLLAHIGSYVPCKSISLPIIDAIIARVGASNLKDEQLSQFKNEMVEVNCMRKIAKPDSLIIIQRLRINNTSQDQGLRYEWNLAEEIADSIPSYCLFETHSQILPSLMDEVQGVKNYQLCEDKNAAIKQYKVRSGLMDQIPENYGQKQNQKITELKLERYIKEYTKLESNLQKEFDLQKRAEIKEKRDAVFQKLQ